MKNGYIYAIALSLTYVTVSIGNIANTSELEADIRAKFEAIDRIYCASIKGTKVLSTDYTVYAPAEELRIRNAIKTFNKKDPYKIVDCISTFEKNLSLKSSDSQKVVEFETSISSRSMDKGGKTFVTLGKNTHRFVLDSSTNKILKHEIMNFASLGFEDFPK